MYPESTRALAVEAIGAGFTVREAAELAGCSRSAMREYTAGLKAEADKGYWD